MHINSEPAILYFGTPARVVGELSFKVDAVGHGL